MMATLFDFSVDFSLNSSTNCVVAIVKRSHHREAVTESSFNWSILIRRLYSLSLT